MRPVLRRLRGEQKESKRTLRQGMQTFPGTLGTRNMGGKQESKEGNVRFIAEDLYTAFMMFNKDLEIIGPYSFIYILT